MINYLFLILIPILLYALNKVLIKNSILLNFTGEKHQRYASKEIIPLSGGIIVILSFSFFFYSNSNLFLFFSMFLFLIGIISDSKIKISANKRLLVQFLIIFTFVYFDNLKIQNTRVLFLDNILNESLLNYLFVSFCLLILVNGTNFIDGLNTSVIGYYLIISIFLLKTSFLNDLNIEKDIWVIWILTLIIIYIYNFFKKIFLGDNGSYTLSFIYGVLLIKFHYLNTHISPYFIILILWYPCFEMLFSVIRKIKKNKAPNLPDTYHLHQLIYFFILKKEFNINKKFKNSFSANLINLFNLIVIYISFQNIYNSYFQILLISINILTYSILYYLLFKFKKINK